MIQINKKTVLDLIYLSNNPNIKTQNYLFGLRLGNYQEIGGLKKWSEVLIARSYYVNFYMKYNIYTTKDTYLKYAVQ